jgi:hypothetical protein
MKTRTALRDDLMDIVETTDKRISYKLSETSEYGGSLNIFGSLDVESKDSSFVKLVPTSRQISQAYSRFR